MRTTHAAGTTLQYSTTLADYPASAGWVLKWRLAPHAAGGTAIDLTSAADGDAHSLDVARATTAAWPPGAYNVFAYVDRGAERFVVPSEAGQITITPDPAAAAAGTDGRTPAEVSLAALQLLLHGKATSGVMQYQIAGRELRSYSMTELRQLEAKLKADIDAELVAAGKPARYNVRAIQTIRTRLG